MTANRRRSTKLLALGPLLALAACSRSGDPAPAAPAPAPAPAIPRPTGTGGTGGIGAPNIPWAEKTRAQRQDYMGIYVLDRMANLFRQWRPDEYAGTTGFRCQTCHGENFDKPPVDFHMPRVAFPLDPTDPIGSAMRYDEEAAKFMVEKVVPTMAELLGEKPYDPKTKQGLSCFRCHPPAGAKAGR